MINGIVIKTDGTAEPFEHEFTTENIQNVLHVDAVEHVHLAQGFAAYVDGEGLLKELDPNDNASFVFDTLGFPMNEYPQRRINGHVLFLGDQDEEGYDLPLTPDQEKIIRIFTNV
jgi:hypothetical protein